MSRVFRKNPEFFHRELGANHVQLVGLEEGVFEIDGEACALWLAIDGTKSWDAIVSEVSSQTKISPQEFASFSEEFLGDLLANKIIV